MTDWTSDDFRAWRCRLGLTQAAAARELDVTELTIKLYEKGWNAQRGKAVAIPRTVMLACTALEIGPKSILRRKSKDAPLEG